MTINLTWRDKSLCQDLSAKEADAMFFPGRGGKINRAEAYCSQCPVLALCLVNAIAQDLEGFYAGTTQKQRRVMAATLPAYQNIVIRPSTVLPDPPKKRRVFRKVVKIIDSHEWLDKTPGPAEEELLQAV